MAPPTPHHIIALALGLFVFTLAGCASPEGRDTVYDIVLQGGRVIDPESGLDAVRNMGIRSGRIDAISEDRLVGNQVIDVTGLVVAPGFIDLHAHGQSEDAFDLMVRDGVTTAFELEVGTGNVAGWYRDREGGQRLNYGVSIGHIPVRMIVMGDSGGFLPSGPGGHEPATDEQVAEVARRLEEGLAQGAVAVGFGLAYTPAATAAEFETMLRVAVEHSSAAHIHVRGGLEGLSEAIEAAAKTSVPLHVVHANSSGGSETAEFLARIEEARRQGQDVTTEAYPYEAGMTSIQSALFDDWETWDDDRFQIHQWAETGERLTRERFAQYRAQGGNVIIHSRTEDMTRTAIGSPLTMIASDGFIVNGRGHPRTSGTYAKVLGKYVREEGVLTLMEALRKMTIEPARRLEARAPAMQSKGRLRIGADADIAVFDAATVIDQSTYVNPTLPSKGIAYVLVGGVLVVDQGTLVPQTRPGQAVRAENGSPIRQTGT